MKPTNLSLKSQLIILGAQTRLLSLNRERNELLRILNQSDDISEIKKIAIIKDLQKQKARKKFTVKNPHWTQKPENRAKMLKQVRKAIRAK